MKLIVNIPEEHLRNCGGEIKLLVNVNETLKGFDVADVSSDVFDGYIPLNYFVLEN